MYRLDSANGDIVISGFQQGIGSDPYSGITDLKSVNVSSIPGEASVSFQSSNAITAPNLSNQTGGVTTGDGNVFFAATSLNLETYQWIQFNSIANGTTATGLALNTPYVLKYSAVSGGNTEYFLYPVSAGFPPSTGTIATALSSSVTFSTIAPSALPKYITSSHVQTSNWMVDSSGKIWTDKVTTAGAGTIPATNSWVYAGNTIATDSNGNGLLYYKTTSDGTGGNTASLFDEWIFVFRNSAIDYTQITHNSLPVTISWVNGWNPSTGTTANSGYLNTQSVSPNPHPSLVTPDSRVNYGDTNYIGNFYQNIPSPGTNYTGFDPLTTSTYTFSNFTAILPPTETAQCLAFVNQYLLIGGTQNIIYPWDMNPQHNTYSVPLILLPELNVAQMVTVGQKAYIFAGNRGNIYVTNGSQADLYKKIPDHLSGTVEPLFSWGGATYNKNRLYFGVSVSFQNGGIPTTSTGYGGVWCIDLVTGALYNAQQSSYGTYKGHVSAIGSNIANSSASYGPSIGYGLIIGWQSDDAINATYGLDVDLATPYSGGQSYIISDMIPIGTLLRPTTPAQLEFKLSKPLLSGETIELQAASSLGGSFTSVLTTSGNGTLVSANSNSYPLQEQQWLLVKAILTGGTSSTPSYNRLTEIRVIGATTNISSYPSIQ